MNNKYFGAFSLFTTILGTSFSICDSNSLAVQSSILISLGIATGSVIIAFVFSLGKWFEEMFGEFTSYIYGGLIGIVIVGISIFIYGIWTDHKINLIHEKNLILVDNELKLREKNMLEKKILEDKIANDKIIEDRIKQQTFVDKITGLKLRNLPQIISEKIEIKKHPPSENDGEIFCTAKMWNDIDIEIPSMNQTFQTVTFSFEKYTIDIINDDYEFQLTFTLEGINPHTQTKMRLYGKDNFFFKPKDSENHEIRKIDMNFEMFEIIR